MTPRSPVFCNVYSVWIQPVVLLKKLLPKITFHLCRFYFFHFSHVLIYFYLISHTKFLHNCCFNGLLLIQLNFYHFCILYWLTCYCGSHFHAAFHFLYFFIWVLDIIVWHCEGFVCVCGGGVFIALDFCFCTNILCGISWIVLGYFCLSMNNN